MDFVSRIRDVRYKGNCPRLMDKEERLLVNSFYLRFSQRARNEGVSIVTPVASSKAKKYYPQAPDHKRCFEWLMDVANDKRLHLSLHDIKEESDIWRQLRQLSGCEHLETAKKLVSRAAKKAVYLEQQDGEPIWVTCETVVKQLCDEEKLLISGSFVRWSEKARQAGLLATTELKAIEPEDDAGLSPHSRVRWVLKKRTASTTGVKTDEAGNDELVMSTRDLMKSQDVWMWFRMLSRMSDQTVSKEEEQAADPWQNSAWKRYLGEMFKRPFNPTGPKPKPKEEVKKEGDAGWGDLYADGQSGEKRPREDEEDPEIQVVKKARGMAYNDPELKDSKEVWAAYPLDGQYYKAKVVCEHETNKTFARGTVTVKWENGNTEYTLLNGFGGADREQDVFLVKDYPQGIQVEAPLDANELQALAEREEADALQRAEEADAWIRVEMRLQPGEFMYKNQLTGETTQDLPPCVAAEWQKRWLPDGRIIYQHVPTGITQNELPEIWAEYDEQQEEHIEVCMETVKNRIATLQKKNARVSLTEEEIQEVDILSTQLEEIKNNAYIASQR